VPSLLPLLPFFLLGAALYTSVGHGGATIYLAILTLAGVPTEPLVTTVLVLNIVAAGISFAFFRRAGHLRTDLLLPLLVTSVPAAYLGGLVHLSGRVQAWILAVALLAGALRLIFLHAPKATVAERGRSLRWWISPALGAVLGFLAGATGIGGGIFLSPILYLLGWTTVKQAGNVAAAFIVLNSAAGLAARLPRVPIDASVLAVLAAAILVGAVAGSYLGAKKLPPRALQVLLGVVLLVASVRAVL
jgi:uncharacterized membrane protein YfcA